MKTIDERVLDIEKADFTTKFKHEQALRMNVVKRVLDTPDEKFELVTSDCVRLELNNDITIRLYETNGDAGISIYQNSTVITDFVYSEPYIPAAWREFGEEKKQASDCELLRNKIKSVRCTTLKVTAESEVHMSV